MLSVESATLALFQVLVLLLMENVLRWLQPALCVLLELIWLVTSAFLIPVLLFMPTGLAVSVLTLPIRSMLVETALPKTVELVTTSQLLRTNVLLFLPTAKQSTSSSKSALLVMLPTS